MRWPLYFSIALLIVTEPTRAEPDAARAVAELRERESYHEAQRYGAEQWSRGDLSDRMRADLAIELAILHTQEALKASPELRGAFWSRAEDACTQLVEGWPDNPRRILVEVQMALVAQARGEQARQSQNVEEAIPILRLAARRLHNTAQALGRELIELSLRQRADRTADVLAAAELESLESNVAFQLARTQHQLALCYPSGSADRDNALLQAIEGLSPLVQQTPPNALVWNSRVELAACFSELGRLDSARKLIAAWRLEDPPADVAARLSATFEAAVPRHVPNPIDASPAKPFEAALAAAVADRKAGKSAAAAERFRQLATSDPTHMRADEAHRLAILCVADLLRECPPEARSELASSYEQLLNEHLALWPAGPSADYVRLWLGRFLAAQRDWQAAVATLQQVKQSSPQYAASVQALLHCYSRQLMSVDGPDDDSSQQQAQLLSAASRVLQPVITGPDNRWPDSWSQLQRETATSLARMHLQFSMAPSPYAERLLTAALRGAHESSPSADDWEASARVLVVEAIARNGRMAEARAALDQLANAPAESLIDSLARIERQMAHDSTKQIRNRELGELALALVNLAHARRAELNESAMRKLDGYRAAALAATGDRAAALAHYATLAAQSPDDIEFQASFATLLATSESPSDLRQALTRWQIVESRSQRGGPRWRRARQARIQLLTRVGQQAEADKLVQLTRLLYPDWNAATTDSK